MGGGLTCACVKSAGGGVGGWWQHLASINQIQRAHKEEESFSFGGVTTWLSVPGRLILMTAESRQQ